MNAYQETYFTLRTNKYVLRTNNATGDRTIALITAPGLHCELMDPADEIWDAASDAWAAEHGEHIRTRGEGWAMVVVPQALIARAEALGFRFEADKIVNFAHPRGEDVMFLVTPWGRDAVHSVATVESFIGGCESAAKETE